MAVSLIIQPDSAATSSTPAASTLNPCRDSGRLHLLVGYEDGSIAMFQFTGTTSAAYDPPSRARSEGEDWDLVWHEKGHREAGQCAVHPASAKTESTAKRHALAQSCR